MLHSASKAFFHLIARIDALKTFASRYGMRDPASFARRFIAGETTDEAIAAARTVEARGLLQTLDYLGESVGSLAAADAATREYIRIIDAVVASGIGRNLSLKLAQLGLDVDRASAIDNLRSSTAPKASSCASTWRARPTRTSPSTSSRCCGTTVIATWEWCCRASCSARSRTPGGSSRSARASGW
jgi:hypothetical protein